MGKVKRRKKEVEIMHDLLKRWEIATVGITNVQLILHRFRRIQCPCCSRMTNWTTCSPINTSIMSIDWTCNCGCMSTVVHTMATGQCCVIVFPLGITGGSGRVSWVVSGVSTMIGEVKYSSSFLDKDDPKLQKLMVMK